jgi:hypothetical protein
VGIIANFFHRSSASVVRLDRQFRRATVDPAWFHSTCAPENPSFDARLKPHLGIGLQALELRGHGLPHTGGDVGRQRSTASVS